MEGRGFTSTLSNDEKLLMAIVRAGEAYKRIVSSRFKQYGLSFPQYNILRVLDASESGESRITNVSRIMLVPVANMTGLAKRLERSGFVERKADPSDERATVLSITAKGRGTLMAIEKERDDCLWSLLSGFTAEEKLHLFSLVKRLVEPGR